MEPNTRQLLETPDELVAALTTIGKSHWRDWMSECVRCLRAGDLIGVARLLSAYGGMGSLTDMLFGGPDPVARESGELASLAYTLAAEIHREMRAE
ncbi:MAG: hypothetical protein AB7T19_17845 [Planctomycetota bacterium]